MTFYEKGDPLPDSGLLGPVKILPVKHQKIFF